MGTKLPPPPNTTQDINSRQWKDWLYSIYSGVSNVGGLGTMASQNANNVAITGGSIDGTPIGHTTPASGKFTTLTGLNGIGGGTF